MNQGSLLFSRNQDRGIARGASLLINVAFLALIGYIIVRYKYFTYILREQVMTTPMFGWLLLGYVLFTALFLLLNFRLNRAGFRSPWVWGTAIFLLALALRFFAYAHILYKPTSDFQNYYDIGAAFVRGDYSFIASKAADYHISSFSGLGVINGLILLLSGTSVRAFQLAQCVISSFSCVATYLIARRFDEASAPAAGVLFALYPANIVFSQVTSNQHIATLFALLSIWLMLLAFSEPGFIKAGAFSLGGGVLLLLSYFSHPSTATTLLAFGLFWLVLLLSALRKRRELLRLLLIGAVFCAGFFVLRTGAYAVLRTTGLSRPSAANSSYLTKVVIGLNPETTGAYSESDWGMVWAQPESEQNAFCLKVIRERLNQPDLYGFFDTKLLRMWMVPDTSFGWATTGTLLPAQTGDGGIAASSWLAGAALLDFFYVAGIFLFAWVGGLFRRRGNAGDLLLWVFMGWIGAHFFLEIQTRYRYFGMPFLIIFAAFGVSCLLGGAGNLLRRKRAKTPGVQ